MKYLLSILTFIFLTNCNNKERIKCNCLKASLILRNYPDITVVEKDMNGIKEIKDSGADSLRDARYYFSNDGCLSFFYFFNNDSTYSYSEKYNNDGRIIEAEGTPLVYQRYNEVSGIDSMDCSFFFFDLNKSYDKVLIQVNDNVDKIIELKKDSSYHNMKVAKFGINYEKCDSLKIYVKYRYLELCSNENHSIIDTINLNIAR